MTGTEWQAHGSGNDKLKAGDHHSRNSKQHDSKIEAVTALTYSSHSLIQFLPTEKPAKGPNLYIQIYSKEVDDSNFTILQSDKMLLLLMI